MNALGNPEDAEHRWTQSASATPSAAPNSQATDATG
jgi:hypothetical protein